MIFILKLVMSFLLLVQEELNKYFNSMKFIYEQLNLMTQNKLDYLTEMIFVVPNRNFMPWNLSQF